MAQSHLSAGDTSRPAVSAAVAAALADFGHWLADSLNHAFGNPREEAAHQPPAVGVQPYRDRPQRRRRRRS